VEAVVYPTAIGMAEKSWLTTDAAEPGEVISPGAMPAGRAGHSELTDWVAQSLQRQTRAMLATPNAPRRIAHPSGTMPASAEIRNRR
jgi:hypothetical protein